MDRCSVPGRIFHEECIVYWVIVLDGYQVDKVFRRGFISLNQTLFLLSQIFIEKDFTEPRFNLCEPIRSIKTPQIPTSRSESEINSSAFAAIKSCQITSELVDWIVSRKKLLEVQLITEFSGTHYCIREPNDPYSALWQVLQATEPFVCSREWRLGHPGQPATWAKTDL